MRSHTSSEVAAIIGRPLHRVCKYAVEYLPPSVRMADGHGSHRLWSDEDVLNLKIIVSLEDVGIKPAAVKRLIPTIVGSGSVTIEKPYVTLVVEKP